MFTPEHHPAAELGAAVETARRSDPKSAMAVDIAPALPKTFISCSYRRLVVRLVRQVRLVHSVLMRFELVKSPTQPEVKCYE